MIDSKTIDKYRVYAKNIGIWDKDYRSIKNSLPRIRDSIFIKDRILDVVGGMFEQVVLGCRLTVYGDSSKDLTDDDIEALYSPLEGLESLYLTPSVISSGIDTFYESLLPGVFMVMSNSKNYDEFELRTRAHIASHASISTTVLSYGIALSICFRRYNGMIDYIDEVNDRLEKLALKNTDNDLLSSIYRRASGDSIHDKSFRFSSMFAAVAVECNLRKSVSESDMVRLIDYIRGVSTKEMVDFLDSDEFKLLMRSIEEYHELKG